MGRRKIYRTDAARQKAFRLRKKQRDAAARGVANPPWRDLWKGMPNFTQESVKPHAAINVRFRDAEALGEFSKLIRQKLTGKTKSCWFPKLVPRARKAWGGDPSIVPRFPIYIVSKGRWAHSLRLTSRALEQMKVPYKIAVEPSEYQNYAAVIDRTKILKLPENFSKTKKQGSIPARNFCWEHALAQGARRFWLMDDNIFEFMRLNRNEKQPVTTGAIFRAMEDFCDYFLNVALAGSGYIFFAPAHSEKSPYRLNRLIYSCILIDTTIPFRFRKKFNEDADLSLRVLKAGFCTVLFTAFLADKTTTGRSAFGNQERLYVGNGREKMADSLVSQHPDVVRKVWKWGRYQHQVDLRPFQKNKLVLRSDVLIPTRPNEYGMKLR